MTSRAASPTGRRSGRPGTAESYQRARSPEQKLARREAILGAARDLALRDGVRAVSLADIAARVGIHKSALLRDFETREHIFLELTAQAWQEWTAALPGELAVAAVAAPADRGPLVADAFARGFGSRPLLPDLTAAECGDYVAAIAALAGAAWQMASPGSVLAAVYASDPALAAARPALVPRLRRTGEILLAGLIPSRGAGTAGA